MQDKKNSYSRKISTFLLFVGLAMLALTACSGRKTGVIDPLLQSAESLLWQDAAEAERVLQLVDTAQLPQCDKNAFRVLNCLVQHRLNRAIQPEDVPLSLIQDLQRTGNKRYQAYGYYVRGRACMAAEQLPEAMTGFKQAEQFAEALPDDDPCHGLIYYCMGNVLEKELLNATAYGYYKKAAGYFLRADRPDYLVYCYRDIARMHRNMGSADESPEYYYNLSLETAHRIGDTVQAAVTMLHCEADRPHPDSAVLCSLAVWLTDTAGLSLYADIAAECFLRSGKRDNAHRYMELLRQQQGGESQWAQRRYRELRCREAFRAGDSKTAFRILSSLYADEQLRAAEEAELRAFTLEKQFDLDAERAANKHLRGERILILIIAGLVVLVLILIVVIQYVRLSRTRMRHQLEQEVQQSKTQAQEREIKSKSRQLQRLLKERVRTSRNLLCSMMGEQENVKVNTRRQLESLLLLDEKQWKTFVQEFEMANNGLLARLRSTYPKLTESDLQYIALAYIGLDNADISILLQMQERTLWNRRQRIKNHLGEPTMNLDDWIAGIGLITNAPQGSTPPRKTPRQGTAGKNKAQTLMLLLLTGLFIAPMFAAHPSYLPDTGSAIPSDTTAVTIPELPQDTVVTIPDTVTRPAPRGHVRHPAVVPIHSVVRKSSKS
ncbi:MAG: hypothetical protein IJU36_08825 [Paludibacteraceae bacterium]|nr:hypothetical protein [Paludibacteraceae bacterium]